MDEAMTAIADELATPAIETQQQEQAEAPDTEEVETSEHEEVVEGDEGDGDEPELELVEIERNGKKFSIPKELEGELLMQADYTRKTQETAALKKEYEAQKEQAAALYQASQEYIEAKAAVKAIESQIQRYQGVNWQQYLNEDPMGAQAAYIEFQQLKEQHQQGVQYLQNADNERTEKAQQDIAKRLQETRSYAAKEIPGYSQELEDKVAGFAVKELGFDIEQIRTSISPQVFKTLHLAWLGAQTLQKKAAPPKPATPPVQPLKKVSARANPVTGLDDRLSAEEWMKRREAQLRKG